MRRASYAVFVILLCALVIGASEGVRRTKETFFGERVSHEEEIDEDMVRTHKRNVSFFFSPAFFLCRL